MDLRFRHLAGATTGLTFVLILLGIHTGSTGGGLSCGTRWPLCNGWLGLFPANWWDFFEWFHRFVAMVVGFTMIGVVYGAWRWQSDSRVRYALTAAFVVLPSQVVLGAMTTTAGGTFSGGFNHYVMLAHFTTATMIFTLLVYATARLFGAPGERRLGRLAVGGVGLFAGHLAFDFFRVLPHVPADQAAYYASSFALLALVVALLTWSDAAVGPSVLRRYRALVAGTGLLLYVDMVLSRRLLGVASVVGEATTLVVGLLVAAVALVAIRTRPATDGVTSHRAD